MMCMYIYIYCIYCKYMVNCGCTDMSSAVNGPWRIELELFQLLQQDRPASAGKRAWQTGKKRTVNWSIQHNYSKY